MTSIYNVRSITLNGNVINKLAEHYNKYNKNKLKTAVSQQALEEAIEASKVPCDYTFEKQHELNLTYGDIVIKQESEDKYHDITYNLSVTRLGQGFLYDTTFLNDVKTKIVYIPRIAKTFDTNEILKFGSSIPLIAINSNSPIEEIIIDNTINVRSITSTLDSQLKSVYCNAKLTGGIIGMEKGDVYISGTYNDLKINPGDSIQVKCDKLYLSSKFFDNTNLDETVTNYKFGNWSDSTKVNIKTLVIDASDIYCSKTGEELKTRIKEILGLHTGVELIVNE